MNALAGPGRVIIRHAQRLRVNVTRFGNYLRAPSPTGGRLGQDGQTSLLEAYLARAETQQFYKEQGRI